MLRTSLKLVAFNGLFSTFLIGADLGDITPKDTISGPAVVAEQKAPAVEIKQQPKEVIAPAPKADASKAASSTSSKENKPKAEKSVILPAESKPDTQKAFSKEVGKEVAVPAVRFAGIKKLFARVSEVPTAVPALVTALKAKVFAHPYIAGAAAVTVAAVVIYSMVAKAEKKPARTARR